MKTPSRKWLEEMADGEDRCQSVAAGVSMENVTPDGDLRAENHTLKHELFYTVQALRKAEALAGERTGPSWRWLDANHGTESGNRSGPIVMGILLFLIVMAGSNLCWYARVSRLESTILEQDAYITFAGRAMRDLTSLLNKNDVVFEWRDGKPVQVFDE